MIIIRIKEKLTENLGLPKEIVLNYPKLIMMGANQLDLENFKGIIEYSDTTVRINTMLYILKIEGEKLEINSVTEDFISVKGELKSIHFL